MDIISRILPVVPSCLRGEPGRNMLLIFLSIVVVVSFGDILLPLVVLYAAGFVGGKLAYWLKQPPLVGMLIAGCVVRNMLPSHVAQPATLFSDGLRSGALGLIMLRAGLGLELDALLAQPLRLGLLAAIPCFAEVAAVVFLSGLAFSFDWRWGLLLGFCLADVSPAVTVPLLLDLQRQGRGSKRGIPSVLIAAASLNAVIAIVGFGVALKLIFSGGDHTSPWIRSFRSVALGFGEITVGLFMGAMTGWMFSVALESAVLDPRDRPVVPFLSRAKTPPTSHKNLPTFVRPQTSSSAPSNKYRFHEDIFDESQYVSSTAIAKRAAYPFAFMLSSVAALAIVMGKYLHIYGAGALTAVVLGLAVKIGAASGDRESFALAECEKILETWWADYGAISLFALLGAAIDLDEVDPTILLYAAGVVSLALIPRAVAAYFCSSDSGVCRHEQEVDEHADNSSAWNHREKLFAAIAWCPKATVQAALSTVALDTVLMLQKSHQYDLINELDDDVAAPHMRSFEQDYRLAHTVLTVAVVSIFWTCLPFAGLITYIGPILLEVDEVPMTRGSLLEEEEEEDEIDDAVYAGSSGRDEAHNEVKPSALTRTVSPISSCVEMEEGYVEDEDHVAEVKPVNQPEGVASMKVKVGFKKPQKKRNHKKDDSMGEDLLGLGPHVPAIPAPKSQKHGHGRFQTREEKEKN